MEFKPMLYCPNWTFYYHSLIWLLWIILLPKKLLFSGEIIRSAPVEKQSQRLKRRESIHILLAWQARAKTDEPLGRVDGDPTCCFFLTWWQVYKWVSKPLFSSLKITMKGYQNFTHPPFPPFLFFFTFIKVIKRVSSPKNSISVVKNRCKDSSSL